ncbi:MAG: protein translocase subunit SecDF, partial [Desulfobulbaceae bacterium]|nr:protein translocase subunit SecDF [Desulfobulbaceae bacterium]
MSRTLKFKIAFLAFIVIFSIIAVVPSFIKKDPVTQKDLLPSWWTTYLAPQGLKLGLDLQGGLHLVLRADLDKAVANSLAFASRDLVEGLAEKNITAIPMESSSTNKALFTLPNTGAVDQVKQIIEDDFPNLNIMVEAEEGSFPRITLNLTDEKIDFIRKNAVDQSLEVIRNRIDEFGTTEPVIVKQGEDEIVVQLPGIDDPERAIKLIGDTAQLEFKLVALAPDVNLRVLIDEAISQGTLTSDDREDVEKLNLALKNRLPEQTEIAIQKNVNRENNTTTTFPILLESSALLTGEMVKNAQHRMGGQFNQHLVNIEMTSRGAKIFANITGNNINRQLAIVLDGVVRSAPSINGKIP